MAGWVAFGACENARIDNENKWKGCESALSGTRNTVTSLQNQLTRKQQELAFCQSDCTVRIRDEGERITDLKDEEIDDIKQEHADETAIAEYNTQKRLEELGESHEKAVREAQRLVGVPLGGFNDFVDDLDDEFGIDAQRITQSEVDRFTTDETKYDLQNFDVTDTHIDDPKISLTDMLLSTNNIILFTAVIGVSGFAIYRKRKLGYVFKA